MHLLFTAIKYNQLKLCKTIHASNTKVLRKLDFSDNSIHFTEGYTLSDKLIKEFKKYNIPIEELEEKEEEEEEDEVDEEEEENEVVNEFKNDEEEEYYEEQQYDNYYKITTYDYRAYKNPMIVAIYYDRLDICKWLHSINDDLVTFDYNWPLASQGEAESAFHIAYRYKRFNILKFIIKVAPDEMYKQDPNKYYPYTYDLGYDLKISLSQVKFIISVNKEALKHIMQFHLPLSVYKYIYSINPQLVLKYVSKSSTSKLSKWIKKKNDSNLNSNIVVL